jgi:hypothetical protein
MRLPDIKWIARAVVVSLTCCLVVILTACGTSNRFNAEAWQRSDGSDYKDNTRCQMVDDLMKNYLHPGMSSRYKPSESRRAGSAGRWGSADSSRLFLSESLRRGRETEGVPPDSG